MNRKTFLASLTAIVTAPFTLKSKEKEHWSKQFHIKGNGSIPIQYADSEYPKLNCSWGPPDPDAVTKEYVDFTAEWKKANPGLRGPFKGDLWIDFDSPDRTLYKFTKNREWIKD